MKTTTLFALATPFRYHFLLRFFKENARKPSNDAAFQTRLALFCDNLSDAIAFYRGGEERSDESP